jgi:SAM-dependent methyltransferase
LCKPHATARHGGGKLSTTAQGPRAAALVGIIRARAKLAPHPNCTLHHASVAAIPFTPGSLDFGYSIGVLHHVPDPAGALAACVATLKPGAPFLVYIYYAFDNRPLWFRMLWRLSDSLRRLICRLPSPMRFAVCDAIAGSVYWPLARLAAIFAKIGAPLRNFPLAYYMDKSFYVLRTDALDRFGTRLEKRFSRAQIATMLEAAGFGDIRFSASEPFWCAIARRC